MLSEMLNWQLTTITLKHTNQSFPIIHFVFHAINVAGSIHNKYLMKFHRKNVQNIYICIQSQLTGTMYDMPTTTGSVTNATGEKRLSNVQSL